MNISHLLLRVSPHDPAILAMGEQALHEVCAALDNYDCLPIKPKTEIIIFTVRHRADFDQRLNHSTEPWQSANHKENTILIFHPDTFATETSHPIAEFQPVLKHELTHVIHWLVNPDYMWWVSEGLAQVIANQPPKQAIPAEHWASFVQNHLTSNTNYQDFIQHSGYQISYQLIKAITEQCHPSALKKLITIHHGDANRVCTELNIQGLIQQYSVS